MAAKLEVSGLTKTFTRGQGEVVPVLDHVSFAVADFEFVAIVGPSGCGKSTLLRIVNGLIPADSGAISIAGVAVSGPGHGLGMVFQSFDLFPWRTAVGNVEFGMQMQDVPQRECRERALQWMQRVGLGGFENAYPHELSGGMQQRVGIARALAIEPEVLLMDEPFGALDAQTREEMQELMLLLHTHERTTVLFVTHDVEEALFLSQRVYVLSSHPGRVKREMTVPFSSEERSNAIRRDERFLDLRDEVRGLLLSEVIEV